MAVNSPYVDACAFDSNTKLCVGCFRTLYEIRAWKRMTDHRRHQVINDRARRQAKLHLESPALLTEQPQRRTPESTRSAVTASFS
ncbi:DUF1289 domain-containing protein [Paraburkholderia sp. RCC_158]|uniref:DUF1289 domain-containing protein n=1 Tax=Paraburkholderia sp. RCC_158 TaxID=3239220 RepID=UPI0035263783